MSNLTVSVLSGTFTYSTSNFYTYIGSVPHTAQELKETFENYGITPRGGVEDLRRLRTALYEDYSKQVQEQINNQKQEDTVPWARVCEQIGVPVTGDKEKDRTAFDEAMKLLNQSAIDGQAQTYFAGLKTEAQSAFGQTITVQALPTQTYSNYIQNFDW